MTTPFMTPSKSISKKATKLSALTAAMLLMQSNSVQAATADVLTIINNIANANYGVNGDSSVELEATSNEVTVEASELLEYDLTLTEPAIQTVEAGSTVTWVNVLTNNSYSDETVELTFTVPQTLSNFVVYQDINENGLIDSGDIVLPDQIELAQGESIQILLQAVANSDMQDGDTANIEIGAVVLEDTSVTAAATDGLIIIEPTIEFRNASFASILNREQLGNDVYVEASYAMCNVQADAPDQAWVTITSPDTGDTYSLKAIETGNNTGKYRLTAPTENNANAVSDDIIQTLDGDTLTASLDACISPDVGLNETPTQSDLTYLDDPITTNIDIVDLTPDLVINKEGDVRTAELGDYVNYTINITNNGDSTAYDVELKDALPRGFDYVEDSVRVDGDEVDEDFEAVGKYQVLGIGDLNAGGSVEITYRVLIGSTAVGGDGINRAVAVGEDTEGSSLSSLEAQWAIEVSRGVLNTDGIIVGKVYNDINRDGIQQKDAGELGVAGVRIFMENGNFVVTDPEGKYSFYGISAKTHVLKVDRTTLPSGVEMVEQSNRNAGDPGSRFVDMKYGELHRADFAIVDGMGDTSGALIERLKERSEKINKINDALEQAIKSDLDLEPDYDDYDEDNVEAYGCKENSTLDQALACDSAIIEDAVTPETQPKMTVNRVAPPKEKLLEEFLKEVPNNDVTFINLKEGQLLDTHKQMIQVQAPLGASLALYVNGNAVSKDKIGKTAEQQNQQVVGYDFYAVDLQRGRNTLEAIATDVNGQVVSQQSITVQTPESLSKIDYRTQDKTVTADGVSEYQVVLSLKDVDGRPYTATTPIDIDTSIGRIGLVDGVKDKPGVQVNVNGGEILIPIIAPSNPGKGDLIISTGSSQQVIPLQFTPKLRPLIAVGIVEGSISLSDFDSSQVSDAQGAFEEELHEFSGDDNSSTNGRAAMFLKGKVRGDYLLTLSYDTDKSGERLFRDIDPDEYYPVYGDSSAKGYDAQSTSKLYVRVDKGRSFAMYGDLKTKIEDDEGIELGRYDRTLTGFKGHYEDDNTRVTTFLSETSTSQRVTETRGLGISGPYELSDDFEAVLENSETVEIIVRDRDNNSVILERETLTRYADYEIDPISESIYLKAPIPSLDIDGNPVYLRVTVEVDDGGEKYWVGGVAGKQQLNDQVSVGGTYINSDDPLNQEELASVNTVVKFNEKVKLIAEYARNKNSDPTYDGNVDVSDNLGQDVEGDAMRVELTYDHAHSRAKAYYNQADEGFVTASSPLTADRTESGLEAVHRLADNKTALRLDGIYIKDDGTDEESQGIKASVARQLTTNTVGEVGVRYYKSNEEIIDDEDDITTDNDERRHLEGTTVSAKVTTRLPSINDSLVFAEYEQDVSNSDRNATAIGGETKLGNMGRLYARHEIINDLSGTYGLDDTDERERTTIGFDANYMRDGTIYSEYRSSDAISARDAEAAIGLKNKWYVQEGLTVNTLLERIESLEGDNETSTAASIGAEYLANEDYKMSGRIEKRWGDTDTFLTTAGVAYRYSEDVTLLAKNIYSEVKYDDGDRTMNRFQLGAAYRDFDSNQLDMLSKVEYRMDDNSTGSDPYEKDTLLWSWHGNYHPTRPLTLSGHYAGKYTEYSADGITSDNTAHMAYVRGLYDLSERWDMGLQTGAYWNDEADDLTYLAGAEVGYSPMVNLWLSLGYNFMGFEDDDIAYDDTTSEGGYFRIRFKFDEDLFKRNDPSVNTQTVAHKEPNQGL